MGLGLHIVAHDERLNAELAELGLEPVHGRVPDERPYNDHMPYSWFGALGRIRALQMNGMPATPREPYPAPGDVSMIEQLDARNGTLPWERELISDIYLNFRSHLICHGDSDGYYLPYELSEPMWVPELGFWIGELPGLVEELRELSPALEIPLNDGLPASAFVDAVKTVDEHPLAIEREAWLILFDSARIACVWNAALVFG